MPRALAVALLLAALTIDLPRLGLDVGDTDRLLLLAPLSLCGALLLAVKSSMPRPFRVAPSGLFVAAFVWVLIVAPLGESPLQGTIMAASLLGTVLLGLRFGAAASWDSFMPALGLALYLSLLPALAIGSRGSPDGRWRGWAEEPNSLGTLAAIAVVVGLSALGSRRWLVPLVPIGLFLLLVTEARLPAIAAVVGGLIVFRGQIGRGGPSVAIVMGLILTSLLLATDPAADRLLGPDQIDEISTLNGRTPTWGLITEELATRPLTGLGPEATQSFLQSKLTDPRVRWGPTHAHNAALQMAMHGGWPAAMLYLASFIAYAIRAGTRPLATRDAITVCILLVGVTEHLVREPSLPLFVLAACMGSSGAGRARPNRPEESEAARPVEWWHGLVSANQ